MWHRTVIVIIRSGVSMSIFASDVSDKFHGTRNAIHPTICLISDISHLEVRACSADACSHSGPRAAISTVGTDTALTNNTHHITNIVPGWGTV